MSELAGEDVAGRAAGGVVAASAVVIVPARLASTRFPEKVLASATGKPLVQHVAERAAGAKCCRLLVVAADHARVVDALKPFGTRVILTRDDHPNGTSRLAEAATSLNLEPDEIVVNAQGDEPELDPLVIDAAVSALIRTRGAVVGTVASVIDDPAQIEDRNIVKVVRRLDGSALYFSRAPIPVDRDKRGAGGGGGEVGGRALRHVGVYAYRNSFLQRYARMEQTPLERSEQLEQLRVLEHGLTIAVGLCASPEPGIDTAEQYEAFVKRWRAGVKGG